MIDDAGAGDGGAFAALYYRHRDWAASLAYHFTGSQDDALDVLQETFAYVARKIPGLRLSAKMTTFLYPVVRNLSLEMRRRRGRETPAEELLSAVPAHAAQEAGEARSELAAVMADLPAGQREVVLMRFVDDFSLEEIAAALRIPTGTVKSRLHNAPAALREDPRARRYFEIS